MTLAHNDALLKEELIELLFNMNDLNNMSLDLPDTDKTEQFRYWLRNAVAYTLVILHILGEDEDEILERTMVTYESSPYLTHADLLIRTRDQMLHYGATVEAYKNSFNQSTQTLMQVIRYSLVQMTSNA